MSPGALITESKFQQKVPMPMLAISCPAGSSLPSGHLRELTAALLLTHLASAAPTPVTGTAWPTLGTNQALIYLLSCSRDQVSPSGQQRIKCGLSTAEHWPEHRARGKGTLRHRRGGPTSSQTPPAGNLATSTNMLNTHSFCPSSSTSKEFTP